MTTKPSQVFTWAASASPGDVTTPLSSLVSGGYLYKAKPLHSDFNWMFNLLGQWTDYLNSFETFAHAWVAPATTGTAETLASWAVSDDATAKVSLLNASATNGVFVPFWDVIGNGTSAALTTRAQAITDTGSNPVIVFNVRTNGGAAIATRPVFDLQNNGVSYATWGAQGAATYTIPAQSSTGETLATWKMSDDVTGKLELLNGTPTDAVFLPWLRATAPTTWVGLVLEARGTTDTGSNPIMLFQARIGTGAVATRPAYQWQNNAITLLSMAASGALTSTVQAQASTAEVLATWAMADDTTARLRILNASNTDGFFLPVLEGIGPTGNMALQLRGTVSSDTGSTGAILFNAQVAGGTAIATRKLFSWQNAGTEVMSTTAIGTLNVTPTSSGGGINVNVAAGKAVIMLQRSSSSAQSWSLNTGTSTGLRITDETGAATVAEVATTGQWSYTVKAQASAAETLATWVVADDATGKLSFVNASAIDGVYLPRIDGTSQAAITALQVQASITTDSGINPAMTYNVRTTGSAAVAVRPSFSWQNNGTEVMGLDAFGGTTHRVIAQAGVGETIATWKVSDDATGLLTIINGSTADGAFAPWLRAITASNGAAFRLDSLVGLDTGTNPAMRFNVATTTPSALTTRPLFAWMNNTALVGQVNADGSWQLSASASTIANKNMIGGAFTFTDTTGSQAVGSFQAQANPGAASTALNIAVDAQAGTSSGNGQNLTATTGLIAFGSAIQHRGSGTVTGAAAFYVTNPGNSGGGTITNFYGVYIPTLSAATNNWAIYNAGAAPSFFGGTLAAAQPTGLGTSAAAGKVAVLDGGGFLPTSAIPNFGTGSRQSVLAGATDGLGMPSFLTAGTGLAVTVLATAVNVVMTFSNGAITENTEVITADTSITGLTASSTSFIYVTRTGPGSLSFGADTLVPLYSESEPLSFTETAPNGGTAANAANGTGITTSSMAVGGVIWQRTLSNNQTGTLYEASVAVSAGATASVQLQTSNDGSTWNTFGTFSTGTGGAIQFSRVLGPTVTYKYLRMVYSSGTTQAITANLILQTNYPIGTLSNGQFWFSPVKMQGYTWNSGTTSWTPIVRVYLGEVVTSGSAVTSATSYAFAGRYISPTLGLSELFIAQQPVNERHNLGVIPYITHFQGRSSPASVTASSIYQTSGPNPLIIDLDRLSYSLNGLMPSWCGRIIIERGW